MPARTIILLAGTLVAFCTNAASLFLSHPYGELVDTGPVTASIADARIACSPPRSVVRGDRIVTVRVQRRQSGRWRTVGSDVTNANGNYSIGSVRRAGRYRAVAPRQTLTSGDVCNRARSRAARQPRR